MLTQIQTDALRIVFGALLILAIAALLYCFMLGYRVVLVYPITPVDLTPQVELLHG